MDASVRLAIALDELRTMRNDGSLQLNCNVGRPEGWPAPWPNDLPQNKIHWQDVELELE